MYHWWTPLTLILIPGDTQHVGLTIIYAVIVLTLPIFFAVVFPQANDLDTIICSHVNYVNSIHDRCLLNKKVEYKYFHNTE